VEPDVVATLTAEKRPSSESLGKAAFAMTVGRHQFHRRRSPSQALPWVLDDGRIEIDVNIVERAIRPIAILDSYVQHLSNDGKQGFLVLIGARCACPPFAVLMHAMLRRHFVRNIGRGCS
jgi:hypothetical protein